LIYLGSQLTTKVESGNTLLMQQEILFGEIEQLLILPALSHQPLNSNMETLKKISREPNKPDNYI